ncbi:MAG: DUF386 domain-containing protein [Lachnospiraceae bacterium]|nr:DUF386 domain-containing protein [Lachnospiraceae bacterium]
MITGNFNELQSLISSDPLMQKCLSYAAAHNLADLSLGKHEIDGNNAYVNIIEFTTAPLDGRNWESHRKYLDIHLILQGAEQIDLNSIQNMDLGEFIEEKDFLPMNGEKQNSVILREGDFLICYPNDAHRTGIMIEQPQFVKKAVFKVLIP